MTAKNPIYNWNKQQISFKVFNLQWVNNENQLNKFYQQLKFACGFERIKKRRVYFRKKNFAFCTYNTFSDSRAEHLVYR